MMSRRSIKRSLLSRHTLYKISASRVFFPFSVLRFRTEPNPFFSCDSSPISPTSRRRKGRVDLAPENAAAEAETAGLNAASSPAAAAAAAALSLPSRPLGCTSGIIFFPFSSRFSCRFCFPDPGFDPPFYVLCSISSLELRFPVFRIEPIPSGNLPPGFDSSTCRSVYVGNIHVQVTEALLQEVFQSTGPLEGCKLIRKEKSSYGFVDYYDRRSAALAILTLNGRHLDARVMWDQKTGRSRGFGFVSFRSQQDAQSAINDLTGKWLGSRQIRCNWATKGAGPNDEKQNSDSKSIVELTNGTSDNTLVAYAEDGQETTNDDAPENNPQYTTVYVGNLAPEASLGSESVVLVAIGVTFDPAGRGEMGARERGVGLLNPPATQLDLHRQFHSLGAGVIEEVRVQRDKGFGFVRYSTHQEAALAIQMGNARILCGKPIKCSWGTKPTPPGTASTPLPPPAAAPFPGLSATDLLAYERQLALSKMGSSQAALLHAQGQHALKQATMGMGAGASQAIYDGGFQNVAAAQQLMYYQ
ncbi:Oligouridylate-binding protein 1B [Asimina triloba]